MGNDSTQVSQNNEYSPEKYQQATFLFCLGMLFIAIDYFFTLGTFTFDLTTDIIGYGLILKVCTMMPKSNNLFKKLNKMSIIGLSTYLVEELLNNVNIGLMHYAVYGIMSGVGAMAFMYLGFYMMEGMFLEAKINKVMNKMQNMKGASVIFAFAVLANFIDYLLHNAYAGVLYAIMLMGTLYFLFTLYNCSKMAYIKDDSPSYMQK